MGVAGCRRESLRVQQLDCDFIGFGINTCDSAAKPGFCSGVGEVDFQPIVHLLEVGVEKEGKKGETKPV